jgi:AcrR family transcriptional regulator
MAPDPTPSEPSLRADALRNRIRILVAAETVLAAKGPGASVEEIARLAGVGVGTVYRHFATVEALREAVFAGRLQRLADRADHAARKSDPGRAFFEFFTGMVGASPTDGEFSDALTRMGQDAEAAATRPEHALHLALGRLLDRAQRSGQVRPDVDAAAVVAVMVGTAYALRRAGPHARQRSRALAVAVDGLRRVDRPRGGRRRKWR